MYDTVKTINDTTQFINNRIYQKYHTLLDDNITSAQDLLLTTIYNAEQITISEIATKLNISSSGASQQVSKLEDNNYVKRQINPKNRREIIVSLAEKGTKYIHKQEKIEKIITEKLYAKLGVEKLNEFKNILLTLKNIVVKELP